MLDDKLKDSLDASMQTSHPLRGKTAIVTGAAVGLGRAYTDALLAAGARIAVCDTRDDLDTPFTDETNICHREQLDVRDPTAVRQFVDHVIEQQGQIDILVNNAGVWGASNIHDTPAKSAADYALILGTNLKGVFLFGRAVLAHMLETGAGGDIVNIATDHMVTCGTPWHKCPGNAQCPWADTPRPTSGGDNMDIYDAAKWGMNGLLYSWAKTGAPAGIRVNQLCMGATDSHMLRSFHNFDPSPEEVATWMRPEDQGRILVELLHEGPTGRNAQSINFCVGRPVELEDPLPHTYISPDEVKVRRS